MKKLAIIIPCYNAINFIKVCLNSLENQTNKNFEVVIIDDASTDGSYNELIKLKDKSQINLKLLKNENNLGAGKTRNRGIQEVSAEYIMFLDADDYIEEDTVESIIKEVEERALDCLLFDFYMIKNNMKLRYKTVKNKKYGVLDKKSILIHATGSTCCKVYKKNIIVKNKIKFLELKRNEDMPFNKLAISFCEKFYYLDKALYYYVQNENSLMHNNKFKNKDNAMKAFEYISESLKGRFDYELEAIFVKEYLYSSVLTMIQNKGKNIDIKNHIESCSLEFPTWYKNCEIKKFNFYQRITLFFIKNKFILLLRIMGNLKKVIIKISR